MTRPSVVDLSKQPVVPIGEPAAAEADAVQAPVINFPDLFRWRRLDFCMHEQIQDQWCWAATGVSIDWYFNHRSQLRQCTLADAVLGMTDCCPTAAQPMGNPLCNQPHSMTETLNHLSRLRQKTGPATFAEVKQEIGSGRPLGIHAGPDVFSGHIAAVTGYRPFAQTLAFQDSYYGASEIDITAAQTDYFSEGPWNETYFLH